ncbi:MAG: hypothetical protein ABIN24_03660 [Dyadobacter sp.]
MKTVNKSYSELKMTTCNCKKATFLIEKRQLETITIEEEFELVLHLKGCETCAIFMKQSSLINQFIKKLFLASRSELKLEEWFKKELQKRLDERLDKSIRRTVREL